MPPQILNINKWLADRIAADIDAYCVKEFSDEHRTHLGASVIGHECSRYVWSSFRWLRTELFSGRMLRLFDRGHKEEERFIQWLRGIGFTVWEVDPNTGQQFRIWGAHGHYGGANDGVGLPPYVEYNVPILLEFKTHNDKSFQKLKKDKLLVAKPRHYAQMCAYGKHFGFKKGLYLAVNKNDDELYPEVVDLDWSHAIDLAGKAGDIITAQVPPPKIALQASYFECKMCVFADICHRGAMPERNCRSCKNARAVENKQWFCERFGQIIPADFIKVGCGDWTPIC